MLLIKTNDYIMYIVNKLLILLLIVISLNAEITFGDDPGSADWRTSSLSSLNQLYSDCIEPPTFSSYNRSSTILKIENPEWVSTGAKVLQDKKLSISWALKSIEAQPRKYLVLFRLDPRFSGPQIFIQQYDYKQKKYVSDFHNYEMGKLRRNEGLLVTYQDDSRTSFADRIQAYDDYFNFVNRDKISVNSGDVININFIKATDFFTSNGDFTEELSYPYYPLTAIYTDTGLNDNTIMSATGTKWCDAITQSNGYTVDECKAGNYLYSNFDINSLSGVLVNHYPDIINGLAPCDPTVADINDPGNLCYFNDGRGIGISIGSDPVKDVMDPFIFSKITQHYFIYKLVSNAGTGATLNFTSGFNMNKEFLNYPQHMSDWLSQVKSQDDLVNAISLKTFDVTRTSHHFGRFFLNIEIGNGDSVITEAQRDSIGVEYTISDSKPDANADVTNIGPGYYSTSAKKDGYLWFRVVNPDNNLQGGININYSNFTGSTAFSDVVYKKAIVPIVNQFNETTQQIYDALLTSSSFQLIVRTLLTLYVALFGAYFLAGFVQVTAKELFVRIAKVILIFAVLGQDSWVVLSKYFYSFFQDGMGYFFGHVSGTTDSSNIFAFLDPILDKYINPKMWQLLGIQLLQFSNGLFAFSLMTIYSLVVFFKAIIQVVIVYVMAVVGISVMIAIAPLFFVLMLFERTKPIFENWTSTLFDFMIKPTILLIFFLFIDQVVTTQIANVVVGACWGVYTDIQVNIDMGQTGFSNSYSFSPPFLPNVPFWLSVIATPADISEVFALRGTMLTLITSTLLFYAFCTMASGLIAYTTSITASLTNVTPARREGMYVGQEDVTGSIMSDIGSVIKPIANAAVKPVKYAGSVFKRKVIDQDYSVVNNDPKDKKPIFSDDTTESFAGKLQGNRHDDTANQSKRKGGENS